jgi:PPOX class probable F420-dependent enzyme
MYSCVSNYTSQEMTMPASTTIPRELLDIFDEPALGHVSYLSERGQIVTFPLWVDFDGTMLLTSSPIGSRKGAALRARPQVAVSIVSTKNPFQWVSVSGRVTGVMPDQDLAFINRMSRKYVGAPYADQTPREVFTIEIDRVSHSGAWG